MFPLNEFDLERKALIMFLVLSRSLVFQRLKLEEGLHYE